MRGESEVDQREGEEEKEGEQVRRKGRKAKRRTTGRDEDKAMRKGTAQRWRRGGLRRRLERIRGGEGKDVFEFCLTSILFSLWKVANLA